MKNILEILSELGITVPEDKQAELNKAVAKNYKTIVEHENKVNKLTEERDTAVETLKGFEGKDFDAITKERDEWKRKHDEMEEQHRKEAEEREFNNLLTAAISEAKGKNTKAISALLDLDKLRASKNQQSDMKAALDALRTESGYLFDDNGGGAYFTKPGGDKGGTGGSALNPKEIPKIKDPSERKSAWENYLKNHKGE